MKKLIILGSTGSIGTNTLKIVSDFPDKFQVVSLTAGRNSVRLEEQIRQFRPRVVSLVDEEAAAALRVRCSDLDTEILSGVEGAVAVATCEEGDLVVSGIVGAAGLIPTFSAIGAGKNIALANKESLVMAGELIRKESTRAGVTIFPVDSEHSAIFQSLAGNRREDIRKIILTASGGPFLNAPLSKRQNVSPKEAVKHPNWSMGEKISIDSATMMNKGLEVIEARWLFDLPLDRIDVLVHPQSTIHSMVEYVDGSVIAQLGVPDMKGPIAYALNYPERLPLDMESLDLAAMGSLTFLKPNTEEFPCLALAYDALHEGGTMPAVLNAANEEAVSSFLKEEIGFLDISRVIKGTMDAHETGKIESLEDVLAADQWARREAKVHIRGSSVKPLPSTPAV